MELIGNEIYANAITEGVPAVQYAIIIR